MEGNSLLTLTVPLSPPVGVDWFRGVYLRLQPLSSACLRLSLSPPPISHPQIPLRLEHFWTIRSLKEGLFPTWHSMKISCGRSFMVTRELCTTIVWYFFYNFCFLPQFTTFNSLSVSHVLNFLHELFSFHSWRLNDLHVSIASLNPYK